jgi:hypothetical protein
LERFRDVGQKVLAVPKKVAKGERPKRRNKRKRKLTAMINV